MVWKGLQDSYGELAADVEKQYGVALETVGSIGFSAMMHGYMAFNKEGELLVPFRTWRNTITGEAAEELTKLFQYNIPQRWSIAHLRQAILNKEEHVKDINYLTTLAGYVHWKMTGKKVLGVGDASGMFPYRYGYKDYYARMLEQFDELTAEEKYPWKLKEILPGSISGRRKCRNFDGRRRKAAGRFRQTKGRHSCMSARGRCGTGMAATNSVAVRTGNVSAGTSVFSMIVLEEELSKVYPEIDLVTTPDGSLVGMVHCNNCTSDLNAWVNLLKNLW